MEDYQEAREFDNENQEIREGLDRAQKLLKQSRKRDYYKILGVSRWDWVPFSFCPFISLVKPKLHLKSYCKSQIELERESGVCLYNPWFSGAQTTVKTRVELVDETLIRSSWKCSKMHISCKLYLYIGFNRFNFRRTSRMSLDVLVTLSGISPMLGFWLFPLSA